VTNDDPSSFRGAPDGEESARFLELVLNLGSFPFPVLFLPNRRYLGNPAGAGRQPLGVLAKAVLQSTEKVYKKKVV
jgi:hypothetical protein